MNPLKNANDIHTILRDLYMGRNLVVPEAQTPYTELVLRADALIHEIIEDYERRGMVYDGSQRGSSDGA